MPLNELFCRLCSHNCCSITRSFLHISLKYSFPGDGFTALPLVNSGGFQTNAADFLFQPDVVKDRQDQSLYGYGGDVAEDEDNVDEGGDYDDDNTDRAAMHAALLSHSLKK